MHPVLYIFKQRLLKSITETCNKLQKYYPAKSNRVERDYRIPFKTITISSEGISTLAYIISFTLLYSVVKPFH